MLRASHTFIPLSLDTINCSSFTFLHTLPTSPLIKIRRSVPYNTRGDKKNTPMNDNAQQKQQSYE